MRKDKSKTQLISAKRHFFAVVCQPHQVRPPLVFKVKGRGFCSIPSRVLYPFMGMPTDAARQQACIQPERAAVFRGVVVGMLGGLWVQEQAGPEAGQAEQWDTVACSRSFTRHTNSGSCSSRSPFRISCHSAGAYMHSRGGQCHCNPWICHLSCIEAGPTNHLVQSRERRGKDLNTDTEMRKNSLGVHQTKSK